MLRCPACKRRLTPATPCPQDGTPPPPPAEAAEGGDPATAEPPALRGYTMSRAIGVGGFGSVWEARRDDGVRAAVKVGHGQSPLLKARFEREAEALKRVGPPNVPELYASGELEDGRPYLAMELLTGKTLGEHLATQSSRPDLQWVKQVSDLVLESLQPVHARKLVHRDLKPENIFLMFDPRPHVKLMDFGLVKQAEPGEWQELTRTGTVMGTSEYMAPEQVAGDAAVDARADIYSFGVILYELLTLRVPFVGDSGTVEHAHLALRPPRLREFAPVPQELEEITLTCLAKQPARRPEDVATLRTALSRAFDGAWARQRMPGTADTKLQRSSLLVEARQPVVLLFTDGTASTAELLATVGRLGGFIARQKGASHVCGFSGLEAANPVDTALEVARDLRERLGVRVAVHLAGLSLRRRGSGPPAVYGAAVERPETWLPPGAWTGLLVSRSVAQTLAPTATRPAPDCEGFFLLSEAGTESEPHREAVLTGREEVLGTAQTSLDDWLEQRTPGLYTVIAQAGLGKSRMARHLADLARRAAPEAVVLRYAAPKITSGQSGDLLTKASDAVRDLLDRRGLEMPRGGGPAGQLGEGLRRLAKAIPVALILDDADRADDAVLDALEYATLDGQGVALWVAVAADPRLQTLRREWGSRANRHQQSVLAPLDETATRALAADLLWPAEYPPGSALQRLAEWCGGNPFYLDELVRTLKREGIVRKRPGAESWYLATAELDRLPPSPIGQWLATRQLEGLLPELAACLRMCSVLGVEFPREAVEWVQVAVEREGGAGSSVDTDYGLGELAKRGVLLPAGPGRFAFQSATVQDSLYELLGAADRERIHRHALEFWRTKAGSDNGNPEVTEAVAFHAGACGAKEEAVRALFELGSRSSARNRLSEADQHYSAALALLEATDDRRRAQALWQRARARYLLHRMHEATEDLIGARRIAESSQDNKLLAEVLLEDATLLDRAQDFAESGRRVESARPLVESLGDPELETRWLTGQGRTRYRQERIPECIDLLTQAAERARGQNLYEPRVISLMMLAPALSWAGRLDEAEARFQEVIALCTQSEDWSHLCGAYANRLILWYARKAFERGVEDLRRAVQIAREAGTPEPERTATFNLAEMLYWSGEDGESLELARRSRSLQQRFVEKAVPEDALLLARIRAARSEYGPAREEIRWIDAHCPSEEWLPTARIFLRMIRLVLDEAAGDAPAPPAADAWNELAAEAKRTLPGLELMEVLYWRARAAGAGGRTEEAEKTRSEATLMLDEWPIWRRRFGELASRPPSE